MPVSTMTGMMANGQMGKEMSDKMRRMRMERHERMHRGQKAKERPEISRFDGTVEIHDYDAMGGMMVMGPDGVMREGPPQPRTASAKEDTGRTGHVYLDADGTRLGGVYDTPDEAEEYGPAFRVFRKF